MKFLFILVLLVNGAFAQTGVKKTPPTEKRVLICCGKATNVVSAPTTVIKTTAPKSSTGSKQ